MSEQDIFQSYQEELAAFKEESEKLSAYDYEKRFKEITDKYNHLLFQSSVGDIPSSKNKKHTVQSSFGKIEVKKKDTR